MIVPVAATNGTMLIEVTSYSESVTNKQTKKKQIGLIFHTASHFYFKDRRYYIL
jgi:hypothetical protein